ncbi:MAG: transketolase [Actinobacteria bacterium]|nr:transketolase [Actinomycetota bacterium]
MTPVDESTAELSQEDYLDLREYARRIRVAILQAVAAAKSSHVGSAFSCVELLVSLYFRALKVDPRRPQDPGRDRFVMSKAHAGIALYATLAERGFIPHSVLREYCVDGGTLAGHADAHGVPGVEVSAGSLGHGLAISVGMALRAKRVGQSWRVVALLSDGECDEGSTWEAALLASHLRLDALTAIVDYNGLQGMGPTREVVNLDPIADKWRSFGWATREIEGHNWEEIGSALAELPLERGRPTAIIARTTKGKGVSFMEDQVLWHYRSPAGDELERAFAELRP